MRLLAGAWLAAFCVLLSLPARSAAPTEIWWAPQNGVALSPKQVPLGRDFPQLFAKNAAWGVVRAHLYALQLSEAPFTRKGYSGFELNKIVKGIEGLQAAGTNLDFVITAVPVGHPTHREGLMANTRQLELRLRQLRRLGLNLDSVTMDTPLINGSINHIRENGIDLNPGYPIAETARRVAISLSVVRKIYPHIKVYDAEGPQHQPLPVWEHTLHAWLNAYQQSTGRRLDGMTLDMGWTPGWEKAIADTCEILHAAGTRCGVILDAPGLKGMTDLEWNQAVLRFARTIDQRGGLGLDYVAFESWQGHPALNLPEDSPGSYTGLVLSYIRRYLLR